MHWPKLRADFSCSIAQGEVWQGRNSAIARLKRRADAADDAYQGSRPVKQQWFLTNG